MGSSTSKPFLQVITRVRPRLWDLPNAPHPTDFFATQQFFLASERFGQFGQSPVSSSILCNQLEFFFAVVISKKNSKIIGFELFYSPINEAGRFEQSWKTLPFLTETIEKQSAIQSGIVLYSKVTIPPEATSNYALRIVLKLKINGKVITYENIVDECYSAYFAPSRVIFGFIGNISLKMGYELFSEFFLLEATDNLTQLAAEQHVNVLRAHIAWRHNLLLFLIKYNNWQEFTESLTLNADDVDFNNVLLSIKFAVNNIPGVTSSTIHEEVNSGGFVCRKNYDVDFLMFVLMLLGQAKLLLETNPGHRHRFLVITPRICVPEMLTNLSNSLFLWDTVYSPKARKLPITPLQKRQGAIWTSPASESQSGDVSGKLLCPPKVENFVTDVSSIEALLNAYESMGATKDLAKKVVNEAIHNIMNWIYSAEADTLKHLLTLTPSVTTAAIPLHRTMRQLAFPGVVLDSRVFSDSDVIPLCFSIDFCMELHAIVKAVDAAKNVTVAHSIPTILPAFLKILINRAPRVCNLELLMGALTSSDNLVIFNAVKLRLEQYCFLPSSPSCVLDLDFICSVIRSYRTLVETPNKYAECKNVLFNLLIKNDSLIKHLDLMIMIIREIADSDIDVRENGFDGKWSEFFKNCARSSSAAYLELCKSNDAHGSPLLSKIKFWNKYLDKEHNNLYSWIGIRKDLEGKEGKVIQYLFCRLNETKLECFVEDATNCKSCTQQLTFDIYCVKINTSPCLKAIFHGFPPWLDSWCFPMTYSLILHVNVDYQDSSTMKRIELYFKTEVEQLHWLSNLQMTVQKLADNICYPTTGFLLEEFFEVQVFQSGIILSGKWKAANHSCTNRYLVPIIVESIDPNPPLGWEWRPVDWVLTTSDSTPLAKILNSKSCNIDYSFTSECDENGWSYVDGNGQDFKEGKFGVGKYTSVHMMRRRRFTRSRSRIFSKNFEFFNEQPRQILSFRDCVLFLAKLDIKLSFEDSSNNDVLKALMHCPAMAWSQELESVISEGTYKVIHNSTVKELTLLFHRSASDLVRSSHNKYHPSFQNMYLSYCNAAVEQHMFPFMNKYTSADAFSANSFFSLVHLSEEQVLFWFTFLGVVCAPASSVIIWPDSITSLKKLEEAILSQIDRKNLQYVPDVILSVFSNVCVNQHVLITTTHVIPNDDSAESDLGTFQMAAWEKMNKLGNDVSKEIIFEVVYICCGFRNIIFLKKLSGIKSIYDKFLSVWSYFCSRGAFLEDQTKLNLQAMITMQLKWHVFMKDRLTTIKELVEVFFPSEAIFTIANILDSFDEYSIYHLFQNFGTLSHFQFKLELAIMFHYPPSAELLSSDFLEACNFFLQLNLLQNSNKPRAYMEWFVQLCTHTASEFPDIAQFTAKIKTKLFEIYEMFNHGNINIKALMSWRQSLNKYSNADDTEAMQTYFDVVARANFSQIRGSIEAWINKQISSVSYATSLIKMQDKLKMLLDKKLDLSACFDMFLDGNAKDERKYMWSSLSVLSARLTNSENVKLQSLPNISQWVSGEDVRYILDLKPWFLKAFGSWKTMMHWLLTSSTMQDDAEFDTQCEKIRGKDATMLPDDIPDESSLLIALGEVTRMRAIFKEFLNVKLYTSRTCFLKALVNLNSKFEIKQSTSDGANNREAAIKCFKVCASLIDLFEQDETVTIANKLKALSRLDTIWVVSRFSLALKSTSSRVGQTERMQRVMERAQLADFQSKLNLSNSLLFQDLSIQLLLDAFNQQFKWLIKLHDVLIKLQESGYPDQHEELKFKFVMEPMDNLAIFPDVLTRSASNESTADSPELPADSLQIETVSLIPTSFRIIKLKYEQALQCLTQWNDRVKKLIDGHYFVNFFSMNQICLLIVHLDAYCSSKNKESSEYLISVMTLYGFTNFQLEKTIPQWQELVLFCYDGNINLLEIICKHDLRENDILEKFGIWIDTVMNSLIPRPMSNITVPFKYDEGIRYNKDIHVIVLDESQILLDSVISIYAQKGCMPERELVLFCEDDTPLSEVIALAYRWGGAHKNGRKNAIYCLAGIERLSGEKQRTAAATLQVFLSKFSQTKDSEIAKMIILVSGDKRAQENQPLFQAFSYAQISNFAPLSDVVLKEFLEAKLGSSCFLGVYVSKFPGQGKSFQINCLSKGDPNVIVHIPVHLQYTRTDFMNHMAYCIKSSNNGDTVGTRNEKRILHINLGAANFTETTSNLLFELIVFGGLFNFTSGSLFCMKGGKDTKKNYIVIERMNNKAPMRICELLRQVLCVLNGDTFTFDQLPLSYGLGSITKGEQQYKKLRFVCNAIMLLNKEKTSKKFPHEFFDQDKHELFDQDYSNQSSRHDFQAEQFRLLNKTFASDLENKLQSQNNSDSGHRIWALVSILYTQLNMFRGSITISHAVYGDHGGEFLFHLIDLLIVTVIDMCQSARLNHGNSLDLIVAQWKDSNHNYLLCTPGGSLRFLSLDHVQLMKFLLDRGVIKERVNFEELGLIKRLEESEFLDVLNSIFETDMSTKEADALIGGDNCITVDSVIKMVALFTRLRSGIPVILQGEAGAGKTQLIKFCCSFLGSTLLTLDIHGGTTIKDIEDVFQLASIQYEEPMGNLIKRIQDVEKSIKQEEEKGANIFKSLLKETPDTSDQEKLEIKKRHDQYNQDTIKREAALVLSRDEITRLSAEGDFIATVSPTISVKFTT